MPDMNMQTFEELQRHQLVTEFDIQSQAELEGYQVKLDNVDNPTQAQDNLVVGVNGESLPHWNESVDFDAWIKIQIEASGKRGLLIHGNSGLSSGISISDTMEWGDDFTTDLSKWIMDTEHASIVDNILEHNRTAEGSWATLKSNETFDDNVIMEMRAFLTDAAGKYNRAGFTAGTLENNDAYKETIMFVSHAGTESIVNSISIGDYTDAATSFTTNDFTNFKIKVSAVC